VDKISEIKSNLYKGVVALFIVTAIISCTGYILEIINFSKHSATLLYNNGISFVITFIAVLMYIYKRKYLSISYCLIVYTALCNIIFGTYVNEFNKLRLEFFLRDSLFIMLLLTLAALAVNKKHALIVAIIYLSSTIGITLISGNPFLKNSILLIIVCVGAYAVMIWHFVGVLEKTFTGLEDYSTIIEKQTKELESKNDKLEILNNTKDKFLSILAHDLRNPFTTILGFTEILEKKFHTLAEDKKKSYITNIRKTAIKTYDLLNQLLSWTRSQSGTIEYKPVKIVLNKLLKQNIELLSENIQNKDITITAQCNENCYVFTDKDMSNTIIRNILSNAIKFTHTNGEINVGCSKEGEYILVEISDNGIGMDKHEQENLFKLEKTITNPGTSDEKGSGLGLLLCKDFVTRCGGEIWVKSKKGVGTTFSFTIPALKNNKTSEHSR
jgi:signal transduction histidine kinase